MHTYFMGGMCAQELCIRVQFRDSECLTAVDNMMESFGVASSREVPIPCQQAVALHLLALCNV